MRGWEGRPREVTREGSVRFNAIRLGEGDIVWVDIVGGHDAVVEEEALPHVDHLLAKVVHDCDLDRQLRARRRERSMRACECEWCAYTASSGGASRSEGEV